MIREKEREKISKLQRLLFSSDFLFFRDTRPRSALFIMRGNQIHLSRLNINKKHRTESQNRGEPPNAVQTNPHNVATSDHHNTHRPPHPHGESIIRRGHQLDQPSRRTLQLGNKLGPGTGSRPGRHRHIRNRQPRRLSTDVWWQYGNVQVHFQ